MRNFQDTFETHKRLFIRAFLIYMAVPLSILIIESFSTFDKDKNKVFSVKATYSFNTWMVFLFEYSFWNGLRKVLEIRFGNFCDLEYLSF